MLVVRYRPWLGGAGTVREVLLVGGGGEALALPAALPARFAARVVREWDTAGGRVTQVASAPHVGLPMRRRDDLLSAGVWAVDDDLEEHGAIPGLGVPGVACVLGVRVDPRAGAAWRAARGALPPGDVAPVAVYHGTGEEGLRGVAETGRLRPAPGMLGDAVSVGTFWKATRYAAMTQAHERRARGAVVRAYLDPGRVKVLDGRGEPCPCDRCAAERARRAEQVARERLDPAYDRERTRVADHLGRWMSEGYDTAFVPAVPSSGGATESGRPMYVVKNAEFAVARPDERLELQCAAALDVASMDPRRWDPEQRSQRVE